ncbi:glucose-1-dehydrogenase [Agaricicola taiwanensis]|uniref:Glucose-1-dehydrogenase n=1 Tax=Agaricicola taiwanensis TaxID=591372 RepID=A0A8J2YKR5_9RHOB|nr:SDR family oxidoreductase [Agaricicola taiwanensis]GGE49867.1 glucose-1-dehydrogenase [Agaricicola taiwanensis]
MTERPLLLITGGSRGIGAAIARMAAARGYYLAINYRDDAASAEEVAKACRSAGARAVTLKGDMAREADIDHVFEGVKAAGTLTHFVNNAGITGRISRLDEATPETIRACIDLNVTGALLAARAAVRLMSPRYGGAGKAMVNVSSMAASLGSPGEYVWYAASKAAIEALTVGLSKELAPDGIRVNAVAPGLIATEIHARESGSPDRLTRLAPSMPLGRAGKAEEVAEAALFLLSDAASYITGTSVRVSGGR